ncbi:MAG: FxLYD domain-containing protein [Bryobacteraceae bacterium]|jgi:hypothetical protein
MFKRIKQFVENLAYAGLKPQGGPSDPLYLSNRTLGQKLTAWSIIGIPALVVLGGLGLVLFGFFDKDAPIAPPPAGLTNAQVAEKMLPDLNKDIHIESQHDLDVEDVHVVMGAPSHLVGIAKNTTDRPISTAELIFDLTDRNGSRQGAVSTEIKNIASKTSVPFQFAIESSAATFALVREVHVR